MNALQNKHIIILEINNLLGYPHPVQAYNYINPSQDVDILKHIYALVNVIQLGQTH